MEYYCFCVCVDVWGCVYSCELSMKHSLLFAVSQSVKCKTKENKIERHPKPLGFFGFQGGGGLR